MPGTIDDRAMAFAALLDRGLDSHYRLAAVILGDPLEAEDAVHDAAVVAWRGFARLRERDRFEAWFARILVNGCRDRLRSRRRRPMVVSIPTVDDDRLSRGADAAGSEATARKATCTVSIPGGSVTYGPPPSPPTTPSG